jgi:hypothetical protein
MCDKFEVLLEEFPSGGGGGGGGGGAGGNGRSMYVCVCMCVCMYVCRCVLGLCEERETHRDRELGDAPNVYNTVLTGHYCT